MPDACAGDTRGHVLQIISESVNQLVATCNANQSINWPLSDAALAQFCLNCLPTICKLTKLMYSHIRARGHDQISLLMIPSNKTGVYCQAFETVGHGHRLGLGHQLEGLLARELQCVNPV